MVAFQCAVKDSFNHSRRMAWIAADVLVQRCWLPISVNVIFPASIVILRIMSFSCRKLAEIDGSFAFHLNNSKLFKSFLKVFHSLNNVPPSLPMLSRAKMSSMNLNCKGIFCPHLGTSTWFFCQQKHLVAQQMTAISVPITVDTQTGSISLLKRQLSQSV